VKTGCRSSPGGNSGIGILLRNEYPQILKENMPSLLETLFTAHGLKNYIVCRLAAAYGHKYAANLPELSLTRYCLDSPNCLA
jgi:hypothetical protein